MFLTYRVQGNSVAEGCVAAIFGVDDRKRIGLLI